MKLNTLSPTILALMVERFAYDPETGLATSRRTGQVAQMKRNGYIAIRVAVGSKNYTMSVHRFAFYSMTGAMPEYVYRATPTRLTKSASPITRRNLRMSPVPGR